MVVKWAKYSRLYMQKEDIFIKKPMFLFEKKLDLAALNEFLTNRIYYKEIQMAFFNLILIEFIKIQFDYFQNYSL